MNNKTIENYSQLTKAVLKSITDSLEGDFEYTYYNNNQFFSKVSSNDCSVHAFEDGQSFHFSIRSRTMKDQEAIMTALKRLYPFDMTLYQSTINTLSDFYQALAFTVEPIEIENIENFSWSTFLKRRTDGVKNWENFDHFYYNFKLYPWKKKVINLAVTQIIKMIIVDDEGTKKYIPVMETSVPLNESKRTKICISLDKDFANIYVLKKNGVYEIETMENILKMINKGIRNYIFNILYQRYQIEISKSDFATLNMERYSKYVTLNEMAEI